MKKTIEISQKEEPEFDRDKDIDKKLLRVQKRLVTSLVGEDVDEDNLKRKRKRTISEPKHLRIKISIGKGEKNSVLACSSLDSDNEKEYDNSTNKEMRKTKSPHNPSIDKEEEFEDGNMRSRKSKFMRKEIPNQHINGEAMRARRSKSIHRETLEEINQSPVGENYEPAIKGHRSRSLSSRPDKEQQPEPQSGIRTPTKFRSRSKSIDTKRASKRSSRVVEENAESVVIKRSKPLDVSKRLKKATFVLKDPFCWICHKEGTAWSCTQCPRTFHLKCAPETAHSMCADCSSAMIADSPQYSRLTLDQLSKLLKYALQRMKYVGGSEVFWRAVNPVEQPLYYQYVKNPMDLSLLEQNIDLQTYGSTGEFVADAKWILHNSIIFNTQQSPLTAAARAITKVCKQESQEIDKCPDCYLNAHTNPEWFIQVCNKPHLLIWARLKGFPFWPAKVLTVNFKSQMVDARFFGAHDKAWVPVRECFLLSENAPPSGAKKRGGDLEFAFVEMNNHVNEIRRKFGTFVLAPDKTPFIPENCDEHLDDMVPLWRIPPKTKQRHLKNITVRRIVINTKTLDKPKSKGESPEDEMVRNLELMTPKTPLDDKVSEDTSTSTDYEDYICNPRTPEHGYSIAPVEDDTKPSENGIAEKNEAEAEYVAEPTSNNTTSTEQVHVISEKVDESEEKVQLMSEEPDTIILSSDEKTEESPNNSSEEIIRSPKSVEGTAEMQKGTEENAETEKPSQKSAETQKITEETLTTKEISQKISKTDKSIEKSLETEKSSEIFVETPKNSPKSQENTDKIVESQNSTQTLVKTGEPLVVNIVDSPERTVEISKSTVKVSENLQTCTEPKTPVEIAKTPKNVEKTVQPLIQVEEPPVSPVKVGENIKKSEVKISEASKTLSKPKIPVETPKTSKNPEKISETSTPKTLVRVAENLKLVAQQTIHQETVKPLKIPSGVSLKPKKPGKVVETRKKVGKIAPKVASSSSSSSSSSPVKEQLTFNATKPIVSYSKKDKKPKESKDSDEASTSSCSVVAPDVVNPELVDVKQEIYDQYLYEESQRVADISSAIRSLECDRQPMVTIVDVNRLCAQRKGKDSSSKTQVGKSAEGNAKNNNNNNNNGKVRLSPEVSLVMVDSETETISNDDSRQSTTANKARKSFPRLPDRAESSVTISTSTNEISAKPSPRSMNVISVNTKNSDAQKILLKSLCLEERKQDKNETVRDQPAEVSNTRPKTPGKDGPASGGGACATRPTKNIVVSSAPSTPSIPPNINGPLLISQNGQAFIANTSSPNITIAQNNLGQISLLQLTNLTSSIPNFVNLGNECNPVPPYGSVYTTPPPLSPFTNAPPNVPSAIIKPQTNGLMNGSAENRQSPRPAMISVKSNSALLEPTAAISNCQPNQSSSVEAVMSEVNRLANDISESLKDTIKEIVLKFLQDGIPEGKLKLLNQEKKKIIVQHQKTMAHLRTVQDEQLAEFRSQMIEEKERDLKKLKLEMEKVVEETKSKQWCSTCHKEALFYCCWNTSYCDYKCQEDHWPTHMTTCGQVRNQIETNTSVVNTTKKRSSAPTKKQLRMNPSSYSIVSYSGPSAKK